MKALIYDGPMQLHVADIERPVPGTGEVAVRIRAAGICGSDIHGFTGVSKRRVPGMVMGHEIAGEIVEVGEGVPVARRGQRVAVNPTIGCSSCTACKAGKTNRCRDRHTVGVNMGTRGGFAEVVIVPQENCIPLADHIPYSLGALAEPLAVGLHAIGLVEAAPSQRMLIIGGGTIGLCTLLCAKRQGAIVYLIEPVGERLQLAARLGAHPLEVTNGEIGSGARSVEPDGMDIVIDAVGISTTLAGALDAVVYGGTVVWLGNAEPTVQLPCNPVLVAERLLRGSYGYTVGEYRDAVELINHNHVDLSFLLSQSCSLYEAPAMFTALARGESQAIKVIIEP